MDASQYKDYVLTLLFVKYVSDKWKADKQSLIEVPDGGSFDDLVALKGKTGIGEGVNVAIQALADANELSGVINNADFDDRTKLGDGQALVDRISNLIGIFQDLDFSGSRAEGDDLLGDAYEYLMRHFATESGKSKGQFYTPAEVSRVVAQLVGLKADTPKSATAYDPTCGSGSLLLKVADAAPNGLSLYGQEMDNATYALSRMNMILHGNETAEIAQGNTLADPKFLKDSETLQTFDFLIANPPFSWKSWTNGLTKEYGRFDGYARPPKKNGDYAFLLHMLKSLKSTGKGAVILPHGILFRGNTEAAIRKEIVKRGYIKGIIGLPSNLFYGTGIPASIIVLDKESSAGRVGIFMIDASKGFEKAGPKNRLRPRDMHKIVDVFTNQIELPGYSRMVPVSEIADRANDYNLNIPRYIEPSGDEDIQDLHAHLHGGIPNRDIDALAPYWDAFPTLRSQIFRPVRDGYSELAVDRKDVHKVVATSPEYQKFFIDITAEVDEWWTSHRADLEGITRDTRPSDLIESVSEDLLERFRKLPLIDEYGVYEQLMRYWNGTMHDDVSLIMGEGWVAASRPRPARIVGYDEKKKPKFESADVVFGTGVKAERWVMDLLPPGLIIDRYFEEQKLELDKLALDVESAAQTLKQYIEEHAVEEGLLFEAVDHEGKLTSKAASARLKQAVIEASDDEEIAALKQVLALYRAEAAAKKSMKLVSSALDNRIIERYGKVSAEDVQILIVEDKWGATIKLNIIQVLSDLRERLVERIRLLATRYGQTLGSLERDIEELSNRVERHLAEMGIE
ncbi:N-6 DNA methylase [Arthrobacter sp. MPF02]|uniref:N-6 DNA methylase n=1 Tax=Arthrobacter sp. MPF02 TaxID=3388492 RepID=UPI0039850D19